MQVLITHGSMSRSRVLHFQRWQLLLSALGLVLALMLTSGAVYHFVFLKAASEGWPVFGPLLKLVVRDESAQRERFMRDNLDAIAQKVGEMQAKLVRLQAMGERVQGLAGLKPEDLSERPARPAAAPAVGSGGPFVAAVASPSLAQLKTLIESMDAGVDFETDFFTLVEARLLESRVQALMVPSAAPVEGPVGSGFGFRTDPLNGRSALHMGLDFPAETGTAIRAAAGGMVVAVETHPEYGRLLEIDHGNGLATRYAHCSAIDVPLGALVRRGQRVASVGTTGRSTGAHLHFEVLLNGAPQDPAKFLAGRAAPPVATAVTVLRR